MSPSRNAILGLCSVLSLRKKYARQHPDDCLQAEALRAARPAQLARPQAGGARFRRTPKNELKNAHGNTRRSRAMSGGNDRKKDDRRGGRRSQFAGAQGFSEISCKSLPQKNGGGGNRTLVPVHFSRSLYVRSRLI